MGLDICRIHLCSNSESLNRPVCVAVASNDPNSISCSEYRLSDFTKLVPSLLAFRHERQYSPPLEQGD